MNKTIRTLQVSDVLSVYSGRCGKCCCGCAGKHSYSKAALASGEGAAKRGYALTSSDVNDRMVAKVLHTLQANASRVEFDSADTISLVVESRLYIVYLRKGVSVTAPVLDAALCDEVSYLLAQVAS